MKKTIYLWVTGNGWAPFDFETAQTELANRNITIGDRATIGDDATIFKTIFITGSKNAISWWGISVINIGCIQLSIDEWKLKYKNLGADNQYSNEQIEEYYEYILMIE